MPLEIKHIPPQSEWTPPEFNHSNEETLRILREPIEELNRREAEAIARAAARLEGEERLEYRRAIFETIHDIRLAYEKARRPYVDEFARAYSMIPMVHIIKVSK